MYINTHLSMLRDRQQCALCVGGTVVASKINNIQRWTSSVHVKWYHHVKYSEFWAKYDELYPVYLQILDCV